MTSEKQILAAQLAVARAGHRKGSGAPIRRAFVTRESESDRSPLAYLISGQAAEKGGGGRGGRVRVLLLLSLIWIAAAHPYSTNRPARFWAELLGLDDPDGNGARTIRSSFRELERRGFIKIEEGQPGFPPTIFLLNETGNGEPYSIPAVAGMEGGEKKQTSYMRVPQSLWESGLVTDISGPGLAMYLICLSQDRRDRDDTFWFSASYFKERFGLSESTRKKGMRELVDLGVLGSASASIDGQNSTLNRRFKRNVYVLATKYRSPEIVPDQAASERPALSPKPASDPNPLEALSPINALLKRPEPPRPRRKINGGF